jgi:NAD(P)-dependent dehydrogenase (short-subunit alcohol dehydrogenase family)
MNSLGSCPARKWDPRRDLRFFGVSGGAQVFVDQGAQDGFSVDRPAVEVGNAGHPGLIGDSPKWRDVQGHPHMAATPIGRLVMMEEVADATDFLLHNTGVNAHDLHIDGGFLIR